MCSEITDLVFFKLLMSRSNSSHILPQQNTYVSSLKAQLFLPRTGIPSPAEQLYSEVRNSLLFFLYFLNINEIRI